MCCLTSTSTTIISAKKKKSHSVLKPNYEIRSSKKPKKSNSSSEGEKGEQSVQPILSYLIDVDTLRTLIRKKAIRVVDVRRSEEYDKGHIESAVSIPLALVLDAESPEKVINIMQGAGIGDHTPVAVYDDTFGALAARVAWTFQHAGHTNTSLLELTFSQWKKHGLETEKKINKFPLTRHSLNVNKDIYADAEDVERTKGTENNILLDSRERLNFLTEHIPGATNLPYTMLRTQESILRTASEIKRFLENRSISSESEVIAYCGSVGTLSGLAYYALKMAGVKNVRLYSKSFKDWKRLGKPVDEFNDANYWDLSAE